MMTPRSPRRALAGISYETKREATEREIARKLTEAKPTAAQERKLSELGYTGPPFPNRRRAAVVITRLQEAAKWAKKGRSL